jgi:hypothetical protein
VFFEWGRLDYILHGGHSKGPHRGMGKVVEG